MFQAKMYFFCFFKKSDGLYFILANWLFLIVIDVDIVLDVSENSYGNIYSMKFSVKLQPTNMEFVNPSRLKFLPDFPQKSFLEVIYKSSCSALINAEYINFCSSGSKLESITYKFTKIVLCHSNFSKNFTFKCRTAILKNASWWLLLMATLFRKISWMAALGNSWKEILSYTNFTFLTLTSS